MPKSRMMTVAVQMKKIRIKLLRKPQLLLSQILARNRKGKRDRKKKKKKKKKKTKKHLSLLQKTKSI